MRIVRESFLFSGTKGRRSVEKRRVRTGAENMLPEAVFFSSCKNAAGNGVEDAPGHGEAAAGAEHGE